MPTTSTSPISRAVYDLPSTTSDPDLLPYVHSRPDKQPIVVVQGLGFVGLAMSLVLANTEKFSYSVIGIDLPTKESYWKIGDIKNGICPISSADPKIPEYFQNSKQNGNFLPTYDVQAYEFANVIIVDINLDVDKISDSNGSLEASNVPMAAFEKAIQSISERCKQDVLILVETTVPPGTCDKIVKPILENGLKKRNLPTNEFKLGHSYERVMPGPNYLDSIKNFYRVYSGIDDRSATETENFLKTVISTDTFPLTRLKNTQSSEMAKVLENSYRAMNISFMVEWSRFAENAGVDLYEVVKAIRLRPTHSNMMLPGIGVGGYCLTKDPVMASWASQNFFGLDDGLSSSVNAVQINDSMPKYAYDFTNSCLSRVGYVASTVAILGVSYAPGVGDTRFSPVETFVRLLMNEVKSIELYDPYVDFWPEMDHNVSQDISALKDSNPSLIIITTGHKDFISNDLLYKTVHDMKQNPLIIDTVGLIDQTKLSEDYVLGHNLFILGVG